MSLNKALHPVLAVDDTVRLLNRAYKPHDGIESRLIDLRLRRHVAKTPMVLPNALCHCPGERCIGMMTGVVDRVQERWTFVGARTITSVALRAIGVIRGLSSQRALRQLHILAACRRSSVSTLDGPCDDSGGDQCRNDPRKTDGKRLP
jgi:hypothetical protein